MGQETLMKVEELDKWFPIKGGLLQRTVGQVKAVDDVTFEVRTGETTGLVGESGCGKTTLARTMVRLTDATRGRIIFDGTDITKMKGKKLKPFRRRMQVVFQDPYASLDPRQSVLSTLTEPMKLHGMVSGKAEARAAAEKLIDLVGLNRDHLARFPHEFSGGQRQRIAIARALSIRPDFVLLDEPTSSLDVSVQAQILSLLESLQKEFSLTYLFISHNLSVIRYMCHRIGVMYLGHIVEVADRTSIYEDPRHPYTYALLRSAPVPDPKARKGLALLQGDVPSPVDIPSGCRFRTRCPYATERCAREVPEPRTVSDGHFVECHYNIDFKTKAAVPA